MLEQITGQFEGVFSEISIDSEKRIIRNAVLCGLISQNNRRYTLDCLKNAVPLYENSKIYIDHPNERDEKRGCRSTRDLAGKVENARFEGQKIRGDIHLLNTEGGRLVFEIAQSAPDAAGFSHNAMGEYHREGDVEVVTRLEKVVSVDLVTEPATVSGIYEGLNKESEKSEAEKIAGGLKQDSFNSLTTFELEDKCIGRDTGEKKTEANDVQGIADMLKG